MRRPKLYRVSNLLRFSTVSAILLFLYLVSWALPQTLNPPPTNRERRLEDERWIDTSRSWLDRQACRWLSLCGLRHIRPDPPERRSAVERRGGEMPWGFPSPGGGESWRRSWDCVGRREAEKDCGSKRHQRDVPNFVLEYAPFVYLHSREHFWPADIAEHLRHMAPVANEAELDISEDLSLHNLHLLNGGKRARVVLKSKDNVESRPRWLHSRVGIPLSLDAEDAHIGKATSGADHGAARCGDEENSWCGKVPDETSAEAFKSGRRLGQKARKRGRPIQPQMTYKRGANSAGFSQAPTVLILVDKGSGVLDAFWFFFYSYNLGREVLGIRFGNHVGDWEHCMIRFQDGMPTGAYLSQHADGQAYGFDMLEKRGKRPVMFSAEGSHALYPSSGDHPFGLPFNLLRDATDRGWPWDPAKNFYAYHYNLSALEEGSSALELASLTPASTNPDAPTSWFHYTGLWGDGLYSLADGRQWRLFGQYHYGRGPEGPRFKKLDRQSLCQTQTCSVK